MGKLFRKDIRIALLKKYAKEIERIRKKRLDTRTQNSRIVGMFVNRRRLTRPRRWRKVPTLSLLPPWGTNSPTPIIEPLLDSPPNKPDNCTCAILHDGRPGWAGRPTKIQVCTWCADNQPPQRSRSPFPKYTLSNFERGVHRWLARYGLKFPDDFQLSKVLNSQEDLPGQINNAPRIQVAAVEPRRDLKYKGEVDEDSDSSVEVAEDPKEASDLEHESSGRLPMTPESSETDEVWEGNVGQGKAKAVGREGDTGKKDAKKSTRDEEVPSSSSGGPKKAEEGGDRQKEVTREVRILRLKWSQLPSWLTVEEPGPSVASTSGGTRRGMRNPGKLELKGSYCGTITMPKNVKLKEDLTGNDEPELLKMNPYSYVLGHDRLVVSAVAEVLAKGLLSRLERNLEAKNAPLLEATEEQPPTSERRTTEAPVAPEDRDED